jgi:hypothetical protein
MCHHPALQKLLDETGDPLLRETLRDIGLSMPFRRDLFVRGVRRSTIRFTGDGTALTPEGAAVAYGLHAGSGCELDATRVVVIEGGLGFFNAGSLIVRQGLIAQQREAAGAWTSGLPREATRLIDVSTRANATEDTGARDLPSGGSLPLSQPACLTGMCR